MAIIEQLTDEDIENAMAQSDDPELLGALLATSKAAFGISWRHHPHLVNYPWVAARLADIRAGERVLDVGAGATPLPVYFAARGIKVDTIDEADFARVLPPDHTWNEWGYLDYSGIDASISSFNLPVTAFAPSAPYDAIYSVSVITFMGAAVREALMERCRAWLNPGGRLLLANDLIPGTDWLWNRGGSDAEPEVHGTYRSVEDQLRRLGFRVAESRVLRQVPRSRTDLHFLVAEL